MAYILHSFSNGRERTKRTKSRAHSDFKQRSQSAESKAHSNADLMSNSVIEENIGYMRNRQSQLIAFSTSLLEPSEGDLDNGPMFSSIEKKKSNTNVFMKERK